MTGIYKITCSGNNKSYIGQSVSIKRRWRDHLAELRRGAHYNNYLQNAFNKYGEESFSFEILELCPQSKLNEREQFYIKLLDTFQNGFNCDLGGCNISGEANPKYGKSGVFSPRFIDLVYQLSPKGEIVNVYESNNLAAKAIGGQASHIQECLKSWREHTPSNADNVSRERFTHKGFYWIYKTDYELLKDYGYDFSQKRNKKSITIQEIVNEGALSSNT